MPKIDIDNYIEQSGMRKARFGGYEPEDVHQAMEDLCADYEQHLTAMTSELRTLRQENDALRRHAQGLVMQNQTLSTQNATLAGQVDKLQSYRANLETQFSTVKERSHSLTNQVDMLRLKNSDLTRENKELTERCEEANSALRVKGRAHDQARQQVIADRDKVIAEAEGDAARIRQQARDDAGRRGAQAPRHGDGVGLGDLEGRDLLAHLLEQSLGRAVHQVALAAGDAGAVCGRDVQHFAFFKGHRVVQGDRQAQRIEAGADVRAGGRDRNLDLHCRCPLSYASSGRRLSTSFTLPPTASTLRAASASAFSSARSTK